MYGTLGPWELRKKCCAPKSETMRDSSDETPETALASTEHIHMGEYGTKILGLLKDPSAVSCHGCIVTGLLFF